ncbi:secretin N-terminal domain-containing protein [Cerasicoccus frondis]|uniref:secretin N-terminal domain-containing protein n=1 Tax=Cerasicoccus frondis TaxID=490090 RepID=UPI002852C57F|nr:secretin N-terminal domain-containing protein [Cerasicoccus frondis]
MRRISLIWLALLCASQLFGLQKMEVFELQNRDAESLVPVIASALGPESRVTADPRTNSLIVSYPAEMKENLHTIINQLDRAEPNIVVEVTTLDVETAFLTQLGITGRNGLSANDYELILPLLVQSEQAKLGGQQRVVTKNNLPAQISIRTPPVRQPSGKPPISFGRYLFVTPRSMGDEIELKLTQGSPSLAGDHDRGHSSIVATSMIPDGGALMFSYNEEAVVNSQAAITLIPLGVGKSKERALQHIVLLHAKTEDYKDAEKE